jgi:hypothetical protein
MSSFGPIIEWQQFYLQSKVGPKAWLRPATDEALEGLSKQGMGGCVCNMSIGRLDSFAPFRFGYAQQAVACGE